MRAPLIPLCALLLVSCSESGLQGATDPADGGVASGPRIEVQPQQVDFGEEGVGCEVDALVRIANVGTEDLVVDAPLVVGDGFAFDLAAGVTLAPDESVEASAFFVAGGEGEHAGSLILGSNDLQRPELNVPLLGVGGNGERIRTDDFVQNERSAVDVLFVIDNSSSMGQEQAAVADNITEFFQWFRDLDLDYHMGVVTTDIVNPEQSGRLHGTPRFIDPTTPEPEATLATAINVGDNDMGDESGLAALELALSEPVLSGHNAGFYRDDAVLSVIILSDEPEQSTRDSAHYIAFLQGLKDDPTRISVSTIVGDRGAGCQGMCSGTPTQAQPGDKYIDVQEAFPGVFESICACDYSPAMEAVGLASSGFESSFELSATPSDPARIEVTVNGEPTFLWHYDPASNSIVFETDAIPDGLANIFVSYPVEGPCVD